MSPTRWLLLFACCLAPVAPAALPPGTTTGHPDGVSELAPIVYACVNQKGELLSVHIDKSSGYAQIDEAALKVARATKFSPAMDKKGNPSRRSCLKFKVKFVLRDGEAEPATP